MGMINFSKKHKYNLNPKKEQIPYHEAEHSNAWKEAV